MENNNFSWWNDEAIANENHHHNHNIGSQLRPFRPYPPNNFRPPRPQRPPQSPGFPIPPGQFPEPPFPPGPPMPPQQPEPGYGNRKPYGPPPRQIPERADFGPRAVDPGGIMNCLYNYTYVWLVNGSSFWFFPTFVGEKSIAGYRWGFFGWSYLGFDLKLIDFFTCS